MNALLFLFKILLQLGDTTGLYTITNNEFKLFVATTSNWNDYFKVAESILRYRNDATYKKEVDDVKTQSIQDVRIHKFLGNHEFIDCDSSGLSLKEDYIVRARKIVASYEVNGTTDERNLLKLNTPHVGVAIATGFVRYITAIKSKPFLLLAGISGTGKSRIVRELARACWDVGSDEYNAQKPSNFEIVQVKPNWHDSTELIGYVSRVSGTAKFVPGPFIDFVIKAWESVDVPHFLCLDEMNLAPVEQYFAEYLSVAESRKLNNGKIKTDPILGKSFEGHDMAEQEEWYINYLLERFKENDELYQKFLKEGITIPQNLIVIGTVNMDETTYSFSRKVLDRAMTIEMNEVNLYGGLTERHEAIGKLGKDELIADAVEGVDVYEDYKDVCNIALTYLQAVNNVLEGTPFKVAYRTRNEFLLYVVNNLPYNKNAEGEDIPQPAVIARALDEITSMKVLSRIEGDDTKVKKEMLAALKTSIGDGLKAIDENFDTAKSISLAKLHEMEIRLESGYTGFWS